MVSFFVPGKMYEFVGWDGAPNSTFTAKDGRGYFFVRAEAPFIFLGEGTGCFPYRILTSDGMIGEFNGFGDGVEKYFRRVGEPA